MFKFLKFLIAAVFLSAVVFVGAIFIFEYSGGKTKAQDFFTIKRGENVLQIAGNLKRQGYIENKIVFILQAVASQNYKKLKAGRYQIQNGEANAKLIERFVKAESAPLKITIAPGKNAKEVASVFESARIFNKDEFLNFVLAKNENLSSKFSFLSDKPEGFGFEGYLFPDNYLVDPSASIEGTLEQILSNFDSKLSEELRSEIKNQNKSIFEIVTMASMLEKEVKSYRDKQIVSGILWKRAENRLPLEVDATLLYFKTSPHPSLLEKSVDSPYNTYKNAGLPEGPISNPGLESIKAAIYPKETEYWFYLSSSSGETIFAKNLGQHLINKAKYIETEN